MKKQLYILMALLATLTSPLAQADEINTDCTEVVAHVDIMGDDSVYYDNKNIGKWYYENTTFLFHDATVVGGCDSLTVVSITIVPTIANLIINKYNWILITNQTLVNQLYPSREPEEYRWYRNGEVVSAPSWRDYNENQELHGTYHLMLRFGERWIKSTKIDIP